MGIRRWDERRAARRLRAGGGEPLPRFRWWQLFSRSLLEVTLPGPDGVPATHSVDIRHLGDGDDGAVRARLYVDGRLRSLSKLPARFPVPGGRIEVAVGNFGVRRCHHVTDDGTERQLTPHAATAEGRRARLHRTHPGLSRGIGAVSTLVVLVGLGVAVPQLVETVMDIPPVEEALGPFELPVRIPLAANIAVGVAAVLGSTERALRLRSNWLDDLAS
ncbi:hypothetical protein DZG00_07915 [Clavibacter lycopersici]|uniref:Uncharacterized protein n=1 Tax=Clavibacter lycopersici TaxID=2301718 RepID=A0A399TBN3_9MICO|nr:hypothetical protein [Clavibacter lycopersici]RIJ51687.1 hypothetical protein DZG00_07915 [Clavibacter lycopersici]RIJ61131.1 hypothetical protein DZG02_08610 [Clavibacter lycopersici]